ncbi:MAG: hypothetical protein AYK19_19860 [Theionarchaea archaeon DG-70-1]|nr:MAG: hypothetical protein AYK19_19860 [Theionarchaea archaeon DG-70-1]
MKKYSFSTGNGYEPKVSTLIHIISFFIFFMHERFSFERYFLLDLNFVNIPCEHIIFLYHPVLSQTLLHV